MNGPELNMLLITKNGRSSRPNTSSPSRNYVISGTPIIRDVLFLYIINKYRIFRV
jgi:hypothetical protein